MSSTLAPACPRCGAPLVAEAAVCAHCGLQVAPARAALPRTDPSPAPGPATTPIWAWAAPPASALPGAPAAPAGAPPAGHGGTLTGVRPAEASPVQPAAAPPAPFAAPPAPFGPPPTGAWQQPGVAAPGSTWGAYPQPPAPYPGAGGWGAPDATAGPLATTPAARSRPGLDAGLVLLGGVVLGVGAFLPWVTVSSPLGSASANGTDGTSDGYGFVALGAGAALLAVLAVAVRRRLGPALGVLALLLGLGAAGFDAFEIVDTHRKASDATIGSVTASVGYGLWVLAAGSAAVALGGLALAARRSRAAPTTPPAPLPYPPLSG